MIPRGNAWMSRYKGSMGIIYFVLNSRSLLWLLDIPQEKNDVNQVKHVHVCI